MDNRSGNLAIIPALNESATIGKVIEAILSEVECDILVVDDGSTDETANIASSYGAHVLSHPINLGVGSAIRSALNYSMKNNYKATVQVDADGQHSPKHIKDLLDELNNGFDMVVGSRFDSDYRIGRLRKFAMNGLARRSSKAVKSKITDSTSGFRAFNTKAVEILAPVYPSAYLSDTVEALLIAGEAGLKVSEVYVEMYDRQGGERSAGIIKSLGFLARLYLVIFMYPLRPNFREDNKK